MTNYLVSGSLGYKDEVTYGTRVREAIPADTVTYTLGEYVGTIPFPTEKPTIVQRNSFTSFNPASLRYGRKSVEFSAKYMLLEGNVLQYVLGKCAVSGTYDHTITPIAPTDGVTLPSRTFHLETDGLTVDQIIDICGVVSESIQLSWSNKDDEIGIFVDEKFVGQRITGVNATSDIAGVASATDEDDAKPYTASPVIISNGDDVTVETPYRVGAFTHAGNDILGPIESGTIKITNTLAKRNTSRTTYDNYSNSINNYIAEPLLRSRKVEIMLNLLMNDATKVFIEALESNDYDNDLIITFSRTIGANTHTITWTFDTSTCLVTDVSGELGFLSGGDLGWTILLQPKSLVSCVSSDEQATYSIEP